MKRFFILVLAACLVVAFQSPAQASLAGRIQLNSGTTNVNPFFIDIITQAPGVTWTFSTSNLSSGADSVINVQNDDDNNGTFIAGNDDFVGLASSVTVAPASFTRTLMVIVRAYSSSSEGTFTYTRTPSTGGGGTSMNGLTLGAGSITPIGDVVVNSRVNTTQRAGGSSDTFMLLVGTPSHAVGFDDDDGVGFMSAMVVGEACASCNVIVANYGVATPLNTNLIWDQEAATNDADFDGVGATLESIIGTSSSSTDSDKDGLNDGEELYGINSTPVVNLPLMGVDPALPDLLVEVDWQQCTDPTCNGSLDLGQLGFTTGGFGVTQTYTDAIVRQIELDMGPLHVHVDNGIFNTNASTLTTWNAWGGAQRGDYGATDVFAQNLTGCEGASPERKSRFHFAVSVGPYTGHTNYLPGSCMVITNDSSNVANPLEPGRVFTHEAGHSLGLWHGGRPSEGAMNFKTNYPSLMNYASEWTATGYSHGTAPLLNPTSLDETVGVGVLDHFALADIQNAWCPTGSCVNVTTGSVDWNRDGVISPAGTKVQGAVMLTDFSDAVSSTFLNSLTDPAISWVSAGGAFGDELWTVGRSSPGNILQYAWTYRAAVEASCDNINFTAINEYARTTDCAGYGGAVGTIPGSKVLAQGPGIAEAGPASLIVVWQGTSGTLKSSILSLNGNTGAFTKGGDVTLPGGLTALGDVTALFVSSGVVKVWAPAGSPVRLKQWTYQSGAWSGPIDQQWTDGSFISPQYGIGATIGFQDNSSTAQLYGAIPTTTSGLEFARQEASGANAGKWTKLSAWNSEAKPVVSGRPGLAYQMRSGQVETLGRFYMMFNQSSCSGDYGGAPCTEMQLMTEGNMSSGSTRRLQWIKPTYAGPAGSTGGVVLLDDLSRDHNLRAAATRLSSDPVHHPTDRIAWFSPLADGIYNLNMADNNDFAFLAGALRASLALDGGLWPVGVLPPSLPQ